MAKDNQQGRELRIGEKIKNIRQNLGVSQKEFAERIGVSIQTLSAWENGHKGARAENVEKIIKEFRINPALLYSEESDIRIARR